MIELRRRSYSEDFDLYLDNTLIQEKALTRRNAYLYGDRSFDKLDFGKLVRKQFSEDYILANSELQRLPHSENYKFVLNPLANPIVTFNRGDFTATNAFFWSSLDLSPFAGALGYTPFWIELIDGAGKKATGYIGVAGTGETYLDIIGGTDPTLLNGDFSAWTGDEPNIWTHGGAETGTNYVAESAGACNLVADGAAVQNLSQDVLAALKLFKVTFPISAITGTLKVSLGTTMSALDLVRFTTTGNKTIYGIPSDATFLISRISGVACNVVFDNVSVQQVLTPPATAVHLVSSLNGTTRDWASIESGFDPNGIASGKIYNSILGSLYSWDFAV